MDLGFGLLDRGHHLLYCYNQFWVCTSNSTLITANIFGDRNRTSFELQMNSDLLGLATQELPQH